MWAFDLLLPEFGRLACWCLNVGVWLVGVRVWVLDLLVSEFGRLACWCLSKGV